MEFWQPAFILIIILFLGLNGEISQLENIFFISDWKLFKRKHSHTIFIYKSTIFIELEGIGEINLWTVHEYV